MPKAALVVFGGILLLLVTFANPIEGNVLGFCPISEGHRAIAIDVVVAAVDIAAVWLIYRGLRA